MENEIKIGEKIDDLTSEGKKNVNDPNENSVEMNNASFYYTKTPKEDSIVQKTGKAFYVWVTKKQCELILTSSKLVIMTINPASKQNQLFYK